MRKLIIAVIVIVPVSACRGVYVAVADAVMASMSELSKMEEAEEQGFLEDVDTLQTPEEHTTNIAILKEQKEKRTT